MHASCASIINYYEFYYLLLNVNTFVVFENHFTLDPDRANRVMNSLLSIVSLLPKIGHCIKVVIYTFIPWAHFFISALYIIIITY